MSIALALYHRMPPASRSIVASLRGLYLRRWRYGKDSEQLVEEILARDFWPETRWQEWRANRLAYVLERAATQVPYYKKLWEDRRRRGDRASWMVLENWPILEKESLRADPRSFVAADCDPRRMYRDHTSGTTGTSLDLFLTRETVKNWYALFEARARRWYGVQRSDRWAILGGQLVTPVEQRRPPFWVWNAALDQLYMSSYHLQQDTIQAYLDALRRYRVKYVLGYPSALHSLAQGALESGRTDITLDVAIANAEPLYEHQRDAIQRAFSCPVRETYGMAEIAGAASECDKGSLHMWPEAGVIEAVGSDTGGAELILTGLMNADMPLIRYRVGDTGKLSQRACECGRTLPVIERLEGRTDDILYTKDGRRVGRLDPVFKGDLGIREAQIVQRSLDKITIRYVPAADFQMAALSELSSRLKQRVGEISVNFEELSEIPRTSRGKFRAVLCEIPAHN